MRIADPAQTFEGLLSKVEEALSAALKYSDAPFPQAGIAQPCTSPMYPCHMS